MKPICVSILALLLACTGPTRADGTCPQTYEFANFGCAIVRGRVIDPDGQPMAGVAVGPGSGADGSAFNSPFMDSRPDGSYELMFIRFLPPPQASSDSAELWIAAAVRPVPPQMVATVRDSVLTRVRVAGVGVRPDTVVVDLRPRAP